MFRILRFLSISYWQKRNLILKHKKEWKRSIKFLNLGGTKTKPPILPEKKLNFNEQAIHLYHETLKISAYSSNNSSDNVMSERQRTIDSYTSIN